MLNDDNSGLLCLENGRNLVIFLAAIEAQQLEAIRRCRYRLFAILLRFGGAGTAARHQRCTMLTEWLSALVNVPLDL